MSLRHFFQGLKIKPLGEIFLKIFSKGIFVVKSFPFPKLFLERFFHTCDICQIVLQILLVFFFLS